MDKRIIDIWADVGSEDYWDDLQVYKFKGRRKDEADFEDIYIPFDERWPQPGFIGKRYFKLPKRKRIAVIGQNPGVPTNQQDLDDDEVMFNLIRKHSEKRSEKSLNALFSMMREFMLGSRVGRRGWGPIENVHKHIGLELDNIAYLNLIPLAMQGEDFDLKTLREPYEISTKLQIRLLKPSKILFYGKMPYENFTDWDNGDWDVCYLKRIRRNLEIDKRKFSRVKRWLRS